MWRNIRLPYITDVEKSENSPHLSCQISPHDRCGEIWNFSPCWVISNFSTWQMWRNLKFLHIWHVYDVENVLTYVHVMLFCLKIVVIYTVLSLNLFCRDLRIFVWRKIVPKIRYVEKKILCGEILDLPKIVYVEKKWQISGMIYSSLICRCSIGKFYPVLNQREQFGVVI